MQDDDYLIVPEVLHTLHAAITQSPVPRTIHLLPAHEHLSTSLRELHVPTSPQSTLPAIHTGFAWLGHGAMLHRSEVTDFLALMRALHATEPEMKMADNYYTILGNRVPEAWFDQGIELGGGQPFTVGTEGDERNNRHIVSFLLAYPATGRFKHRDTNSRDERTICWSKWRRPVTSCLCCAGACASALIVLRPTGPGDRIP